MTPRGAVQKMPTVPSFLLSFSRVNMHAKAQLAYVTVPLKVYSAPCLCGARGLCLRYLPLSQSLLLLLLQPSPALVLPTDTVVAALSERNRAREIAAKDGNKFFFGVGGFWTLRKKDAELADVNVLLQNFAVLKRPLKVFLLNAQRTNW